MVCTSYHQLLGRPFPPGPANLRPAAMGSISSAGRHRQWSRPPLVAAADRACPRVRRGAHPRLRAATRRGYHLRSLIGPVITTGSGGRGPSPMDPAPGPTRGRTTYHRHLHRISITRTYSDFVMKMFDAIDADWRATNSEEYLSGAVVVMDADTGAVRTLLSYPSSGG